MPRRRQAAAQIHQRPIVVRTREGQHLPDLLVLGLLLGGQGQRRGDNLHAGNAVGDQRFPIVNVQPVQIVDRVQNRVDRLGLGDERDHAGVQIEIGQQDSLIQPAKFGGDVTDQRGGAAAALGGHESPAICRRPWRLRAAGCVPGCAVPATSCSGSCNGG